MHLVIDCGNSRVKMTVLPGVEIGAEAFARYASETVNSADLSLELIQLFAGRHPDISACILSSVVAVPEEILSWLGQSYRLLNLNAATPIPLINRYNSSSTLGYDRLAASVAGHSIFPNDNCLVINAGTAITYDFITSGGEYLGGNISPGMNMRFRALHTFTHRLPLVSYRDADELIGTDTESCIQSGVVEGITAEIEGMVRKYENLYPGLKTVLSGGDLNYFVNRLKISIFAVPNIVSYGLHQILLFNDKPASR
jgi:type III pantothenate kinase